MFRRHFSALPPDAWFPSGLKELGYFVNDEDEIRSLHNPNDYFKFFLNKNERINKRQRFEMDRAVERIIQSRLCNEGLERINLPLQAKSDNPHVPIYVSADLSSKPRVALMLGEHTKALGLLATRITGGLGGINKGSMVSVVQAIKKLPIASEQTQSIGIVLANMGQLYWWHEGKEAVTVDASSAIPLPSLVHMGTKYIPEVNDIPGHEDPLRHMESIFRDIVSDRIKSGAKLHIIAIGESCETVTRFLDNERHWNSWGASVDAMLFLSPCLTPETISNEKLKAFLAKRARGYLVSDEPIDTPLCGPDGSKGSGIPPFGFPCYSSGESQLPELVSIKALHDSLKYLQDVAGNPNYENPQVTIIERAPVEEIEDAWANLADEERPSIAACDENVLMKEVRMLRRWRKFEKTGEAPDSDNYSDSDDVCHTCPLAANPSFA